MTDLTEKMKAISAAHTEYAKTAYEGNKAYFEKLATIKAPDQAITLISEHMKSSYEMFVAEAKKIGEMYKDFFTSAYKPMIPATTPKLQVI